MGEQQGERFAQDIQGVSSALAELLPRQEGPLHGLLSKAAGPLTAGIGKIGQRTIGRDLAKHFPCHRQRVEGIAQGAGVPEHLLYVGQTIERMLNISIYSKPPAGACTAVAVTASRSLDGEPVIAKNFDYPEVALDSYLVRRSTPRRGAKTIDVGLTMLAGSHEGINEHGLAVAYNYGHFRGQGAAAITITTIVQELLEQCATVPQAIAAAAGMPRVGGALLMLADASGQTASVELGPDRMGVRRGDALVHANHACTPVMRGRDIPWHATFPPWWPTEELRGRRYHESSDLRHTRAEELVGAVSALGEDDLLAILRDHGSGDEGDDFSLCRHGPYYTTTCSVLLFPRRRRMKICFGNPCESRFEEISF